MKFWAGDGPIIGVVKDHHFESLHQTIGPCVMVIRPNWFNRLSVKIRPGDVPATLAYLDKTWRDFKAGSPLDYAFLDERLDALYRAEAHRGQVFGTFATLAIFVACLGLFGLASFTAERRTREVGIRKVLGASIPNLVLLLSREFTGLVLMANLIAWPMAYYAMNKWLQDFAYRIEPGFGTFALSGALALVIALGTVSYHAVKAARMNPVNVIRHE